MLQIIAVISVNNFFFYKKFYYRSVLYVSSKCDCISFTVKKEILIICYIYDLHNLLREQFGNCTRNNERASKPDFYKKNYCTT